MMMMVITVPSRAQKWSSVFKEGRKVASPETSSSKFYLSFSLPLPSFFADCFVWRAVKRSERENGGGRGHLGGSSQGKGKGARKSPGGNS